MITLIIPAYNEGEILRDNINLLEDFLSKTQKDYEIIISDDGSDSINKRIIESLENTQIRTILGRENRGRGHAIKKASETAKFDKIIFIDADIPLDTDLSVLTHIADLLETYDIAKPSRYIKGSSTKRKLHRKILGDQYRRLFTVMFPLVNISDTQMGIKGFRSKILRDLNSKVKSERWAWDIEILLEATKRGYSIKEIPITWQEKSPSTLKLIRDVPEIFFALIKLKKKYPYIRTQCKRQ